MYVTIDHSPEETAKGYNFVIHKNYMFHFFSSNNERAYNRIIKKLGFTFTGREENNNGRIIKYLKEELIEESFITKKQIPAGAKKIKALSNGSIVSCYFLRSGNKIIFYRPNPNYKRIYRPLEISKHITHVLKYGVM